MAERQLSRLALAVQLSQLGYCFGSSPVRLRREGVLAHMQAARVAGHPVVFCRHRGVRFCSAQLCKPAASAAKTARARLCCVTQAARLGVPFNSAQIMTSASATALRRAHSSPALKQRYTLCWFLRQGVVGLLVQQRVAV